MEFSGVGKEYGSARLDRKEVEERRAGVRERSVGVHWDVGNDDLVRSGDCVNAHSYGEKREEKRGKELHRGDSGNLVWCSTMTVAFRSGQTAFPVRRCCPRLFGHSTRFGVGNNCYRCAVLSS